jgi:hypothetical protein
MTVTVPPFVNGASVIGYQESLNGSVQDFIFTVPPGIKWKVTGIWGVAGANITAGAAAATPTWTAYILRTINLSGFAQSPPIPPDIGTFFGVAPNNTPYNFIARADIINTSGTWTEAPTTTYVIGMVSAITQPVGSANFNGPSAITVAFNVNNQITSGPPMIFGPGESFYVHVSVGSPLGTVSYRNWAFLTGEAVPLGTP